MKGEKKMNWQQQNGKNGCLYRSSFINSIIKYIHSLHIAICEWDEKNKKIRGK